MSNVFKIGDKVRRVLYSTNSIKVGDTGIVCETLYDPENGAEIWLEGRSDSYCEDFFELVSRKMEYDTLDWIQAAKAIDAGKEVQAMRGWGENPWVDIDPTYATVVKGNKYRLKPREFEKGWYLYHAAEAYHGKLVYRTEKEWHKVLPSQSFDEKYVGRYLGLDPIDFVKEGNK